MKLMHLRATVAALGLVAGSQGLAQSPVPPTAYWPVRYAVAMRTGQLAPFTIEATNDGWVWLTLMWARPEVGQDVPSSRLIIAAADVHSWTAAIRATIRSLDDSTKPPPLDLPTLGKGGFRLVLRFPPQRTDKRVNVGGYACGPRWPLSAPVRDEVLEFLNLLDAAAVAAGDSVARPPTLSRPYYAGEVGCAAQLDSSFVRPTLPPGTRSADIGAQFVVDTSGLVEAKSIEFLPGTPRVAAEAARLAIEKWRFKPAERDGIPIRQVVQMPVSFAPKRARVPIAAHAFTLADDDGWVQFEHDEPASGRVVRAWFHPDSVDAWVREVRMLDSIGKSLPADSEMLVERSAQIGSPIGIRLSTGFFRHGKALEQRTGLVGCRGAFVEGARPLGDVSNFIAAASAARTRGLAHLSSRPYEWNEVECPAWLPWTRNAQHPFTYVWRYPTGSYPKAMEASNARADVLISVVVDTTGFADLTTLRVMPRSDPRAAEAVRPSLLTSRFEPATRAGYKVRQRVIQVIRFEPLPICVTIDAGPVCRRRYSDR